MDKWLREERVCIKYAQDSLRWLQEFYAPDSKTFHISYSAGAPYSRTEMPKAATSVIGIEARELDTLSAADYDLGLWANLRERMDVAAANLPRFQLAEVLPLRTFGVLPFFSTAYLARFLGGSPAGRLQDAYVISVRAVLHSLYLPHSRSWADGGHQPEPMHPFLLYSGFRVVKQLEELLEFKEGSNPDLAVGEFRKSLVDEERFAALLDRVKLPDKHQLDLLKSRCGSGNEHRRFQRDCLGALSHDAQRKTSLGTLLRAIENSALSAAVGEIARHVPDERRTADASVLAFALAILAHVNADRHAAVLSHGLRILWQRCEDGRFPAATPFDVDDHGRALFVPSVEIANAALGIVLGLGDRNSDADINSAIETTGRTQNWLTEDYRSVELHGNSGLRHGWCSDRAPSIARIDSWITVHVLGFMMRRIELIRAAKRRFVRERYTWLTARDINDRLGWDSVVDTDLEEPNAAKQVIQAGVRFDRRSKRKKAPLFLLFGPPGTSKTTLAEAVAGYLQWDLISLSPSDFVSDSLDMIEHRAREIFDHLMNLDRCVIVLDEMDSLLRDRDVLRRTSPGTMIEFVVPALLPKLQRLRDYALNRRLAIFFLTNFFETIDSAILRGGRLDHHVPILPYNLKGREDLVRRLIESKLDAQPDRHQVQEVVDRVLKDVPGTLVFRDIDELVNRAVSAVGGKGEASDLMKGLGLRPEIYDPERRHGAHREVCWFLERSLGEKLGAAENEQEVYDRLRKLRKHLKHPWRDLADAWISALRSSRSKRRPIQRQRAKIRSKR